MVVSQEISFEIQKNMSKYNKGQVSKKFGKKYGQERYCKGLIHCECLGDGINGIKMESNTVNCLEETYKVGYQRMTER